MYMLMCKLCVTDRCLWALTKDLSLFLQAGDRKFVTRSLFTTFSACFCLLDVKTPMLTWLQITAVLFCILKYILIWHLDMLVLSSVGECKFHCLKKYSAWSMVKHLNNQWMRCIEGECIVKDKRAEVPSADTKPESSLVNSPLAEV